MTDKAVAAIHTKARSEIVKRHHDEYRALVAQMAAEQGVTLRTRRTEQERAAADAARRQAVADRKAAREASKQMRAEAARQAKIEKAKARLAALEGAVA